MSWIRRRRRRESTSPESEESKELIFTYPNWRRHAQEVEQTLTSTALCTDLSHTPKQMAQKMILGMKRLQQVHEGTKEHETIRKLMIVKLTYPRWESDVEEALNCFLRMEDALAKDVVKNIVRKQRMHNGDRSDSLLILLDQSFRNSSSSSLLSDTAGSQISFTYPGWERHAKLIENTLANAYNDVNLSLGPSRKEVARNMFKGMKRFQRVYDKRARHDKIHQLLQLEGIFSYPNWTKDKEEAFIHFLKFEDTEGTELFDVMNLKQDMYEGDRSNPVLVEMDSISFSYHGWKSHKKTFEMTLTSTFKTNFGEDREASALKILKGMRRLQGVLCGRKRHRGILALQKSVFSFPRCEKDREEAMDCFLRFQDNHAEELYRLMQEKQRMHDGDRSDEVLVFLDQVVDGEDKESNSQRLNAPVIDFNGKTISRSSSFSDEISSSRDHPSSSDESPRDVMRRIESSTRFSKAGRDLRRRSTAFLPTVSEVGSTRRNSISSSMSARQIMRKIEKQYGSQSSIKMGNDSDSEKSAEDTLNDERLNKPRFHFEAAKGFKIGKTGLCTHSHCSDQCYICTEYRKKDADRGCLCAKITLFDERSKSILREIRSASKFSV